MTKNEPGYGQVTSAIKAQTKVLGVLVLVGLFANLFRRTSFPLEEAHPGTFSYDKEKREIEFLPDGSDHSYSIAQLAAMNSRIRLIFELSSHATQIEALVVGGREDTLEALSGSLGQYAKAVAYIRGSASCCKV